jgi:3',5'-cyclic-AMP phosphodiesterase
MKTLLVQLTDLHIRERGRLAYGRIDTSPYLRRAVDSVLRLKQRPDAVVITGDLTDFGRAEEYEHLAHLLAPLTMPVYLLPGNHDDREQLRRSFPSHAYLGERGFVQYAVDVGGLRLIALDTVEHGQSHGGLCDARLEWLEAQLQCSSHLPVVVAMHHPPFETLIGHMDKIGLLSGAAKLETIISRHPNVEPHQVALDLHPEAPSRWMLEPPAFRLCALDRSGRIVTHLAASGEFEGPYPFHEDGALID